MKVVGVFLVLVVMWNIEFAGNASGFVEISPIIKRALVIGNRVFIAGFKPDEIGFAGVEVIFRQIN